MKSSGIGRRTRSGAFVTLVLPFALVAGCGNSSGSGGESGASAGGETAASVVSTPSSPSASEARAAAELDKLALAESDLKGFAVRKLKAVEVLTQHDVRTAEEDCAPLSQAEHGVAMGDPVATAQRRVTFEFDADAIAAAGSEEELDAVFATSHTAVTLASYDSPDQARAVLKALRSGLATCEGGFSSFGVDKVSTDTAPKAGDEAVAFTVTPGQDDALVGPTKAVVFRHGSTIAQFGTEDPSATGPTDDFEFPTALIEAQEAKLG